MESRFQKICRDGLLYSQCSRHVNFHTHGQCFATADKKYQFVKIPKNHSTWTKTFFHRHLSWHEDNFEQIKTATTLVCLRDPVIRWISGLVEYVYDTRPHFDFNKSDISLLDWILDGMVFDPCTVPQTVFLDGLVSENVVWFWADANYEENFVSYLSSRQLLPQEFVTTDQEVYQYKNDHRDNSYKVRNYDFLENLCRNDDAVRSRIMEFYRFDYELIQSVDFYNSKNHVKRPQ